jgi:glycosyltransferase involved in cell wall biosynthesis
MRILHVAPEYTPCIGGSITYIQALSERLASRGHQVTVVTQRRSSHLDHDDDPSLPRRQVLRGVRVCRLLRGERRVRALERLVTVRGAWRLLRACFGARGVGMLLDRSWSPGLLALALRSRWDVACVINLGEPAWAYPAFVARRIQGFPLVGIPLLHTEEPWSRKPLIAELLRRCDALLVNTEHEKAFVVSRGSLPDRTHVAGVGIEPSDFARRDGQGLRSRLGIGDAPLVGFVGRLQESKGVVTVIRAMKTVWAGIPRATLLLAGHRLPPRSPDAQKVEGALAALSADEHDRVIVLDGFAEADKASIFGALDVLAMPSVVESFGIVYLEAWACSKPVIGARTGAVECVIDHGQDGLLVPPHDAGATAAAIATLLADTGLRERLGCAGRNKVLSRFTWDTVTNQVERVYQDLAAGRGSRPASARQ